MDVKTKNNDIVSVDESKILSFPHGIMGFEQYKNYALIPSDYEPFLWLQSTEDSALAFLLVDPFLICSDYEADIDDNAMHAIEISNVDDIVIMTIVTVPNDGSAVTANFLGPILINRRNNKCMQVVLTDSRWTTKFDIVKALKQKGA